LKSFRDPSQWLLFYNRKQKPRQGPQRGGPRPEVPDSCLLLLPQPRAMMKTLSSGNCTLNVPAKNSYRMVVLGASRVGKSSIVSRFLNGRFEDQYTPTIEDFHRKVYNIHGDMYQLDILDTSGNHPFPAMRRLSILTGEATEGMGQLACTHVPLAELGGYV
jgi:hypothetical protein